MYLAEKKIIKLLSQELIRIHLQLAIPRGFYGRIVSHFGLAFKYRINVGCGTLNSGFGGVVCVILFNFSKKLYEINEGDSIAQLNLKKMKIPRIVEVDELPSTKRGPLGLDLL